MNENVNDLANVLRDANLVVANPPMPLPASAYQPGWPDEGRKDDADKLPWDLLPADAVEEIVKVLDFGARKYAARNWEKGMRWGRPFAALMRHMWAWWGGEDKDPETGLSHLAHAGCCVLFMIAFEKRGVGTDDRDKRPMLSAMLNEGAGAV